MNQDDVSVVWMALSEDALRWEPFGDECLVYNDRSGETHFLNRTAAEVLKLLQAQPKTLTEIVTEICAMFDMEEGPSPIREISGVIQEFERMGLICPSPT